MVKWTPWTDRPEDVDSGRREWYDSILSRVTYQMNAKNKFSVTYDEQRACNCGSVSATTSHEAYISSYRFEPNRLFQATWNSPITNRLLLEAGGAATISQWNMYYNPGVSERHRQRLRLPAPASSTASPAVYLGHPNSRDRYTYRASLSYVTGTHNIKTGFQNEHAENGHVLARERKHQLLLLRRRSDWAPAVRYPYLATGARQLRPGHLRAGSVGGHEQDDAHPRPALGLLQ